MRNNITRIFFEFPNFGFGPSSTTVNMLRYFINKYECSIVSTGTALRYVENHFPNVDSIDINTSSSDCLEKVKKTIPQKSIIISNTNPEFLEIVRSAGYKTIGVDTLLWMWPELVARINTQNYYAQYYFGDYNTDQELHQKIFERVTLVKPLIDYENIRKLRGVRKQNTAVISFGGMDTPFGSRQGFKYANWVLDRIMPEILSDSSIEKVYIIGGLISSKHIINKKWLQSARIQMITSCDQSRFKELVASSRFQFLTPGLTSIYEAALLEITPFFLPGSNVSQVLQQMDLYNHIEYSSLALWPEHVQLTTKIKIVPEMEGISMVNNYIEELLLSNNTSFLVNQIRRYLEGQWSGLDIKSISSLVNHWNDLPDICEEIGKTLLAMEVIDA
jgi:hypothetical protein